MHRFSLVFCFLLVSVSTGFTQKVDKTNPLGGEISGDYFGIQSDIKRVEIALQLRDATDDEGLEPNTQINNCELKLTKLSVLSGVLPDLTVKPPISAPLSGSKPVSLLFKLPISPKNVIANSEYYLPRNWTKFEYLISCSIVGGGQVVRRGSYTKPASAVRTSLSLQLGRPIVHATDNGRVILPILSEKTIKVKVRLELGGNPSAQGEAVLQGGEWGKVALIASSPIAFNNLYKIVVDFPDFDEELISPYISNSDTIFSQLDGNSCQWNSAWTNPFTLESPTINKLRDLKISSSKEGITLLANTTADIRRLRIKLGDKPVARDCNKEGQSSRTCEFILTKNDIPDGISEITFDGESIDGVPFSNVPELLRLTKTARPEIEGTPIFKVTDNNFNMTYRFSGDVSSVTASIIYEDTTKQNKNAWSDTKTCGAPDTNGVRICEFTLGIAGINLSNLSQDDKDKTEIPVLLRIDARDGNGTTYEQLDSIGFRFLNKEIIQNNLEKIETDWGVNKNTADTIAKIADLLLGDRTRTSDPVVVETFNAIKKGRNDGRHKVLFGILKTVGSSLLNSFGIPIRFQ